MHESFYDESVIDALAARCAPDGQADVVDVGTGTGFVACGLTGRAATVIGVDSSIGTLARARTSLDGLGIGNVDPLEGDVTALPPADGVADAAVATMVLHHATDPVAMLAEMARGVRPGGTVATTDCVEHEHEWLRTEQADVWLGFSRDTVADLFAAAGLLEFDQALLGTA
jgi:ubiquinone/menaquinone biosynthesis C-methylase UbiE